jgi:hypothetical protein
MRRNADRTGQERGGEHGEAGRQPGDRVGRREVGGGDDGGERTVDGEVVPLDDVADAARDERAPGRASVHG